MKTYKITPEGLFKKEGMMGELQVDKSITSLGGDGVWKEFYGNKIFIDNSGTILKGPDVYVGQEYQKLLNVPYRELYATVEYLYKSLATANQMNSLAQADFGFDYNKSLEDTKANISNLIEKYNK